MPRPSRESDSVYNARRRFRRQAERYIKKANQSSGMQKARYMQQARNSIMDAVATYDKGRKPQGRVAEVARQLGVTRGTMVARGFALGASQSGITHEQVSELVLKSYSALSKVGESRTQMARNLLQGNVGNRFYAGLSEIWAGTAEGRRDPEAAIVRHFGVSSLMDVVEELEDAGIDIYTPEVEEQGYQRLALQVMQYASARGR